MTTAEQAVVRGVLEHLALRYTASGSASRRNAIVLVADRLVVDGGARLIIDAAGARVVEPEEVDRG